MIKVFCSPITKLVLFTGGFVAAFFALRAQNLIFDRAVAFALNRGAIMHRPVNMGVFYGRGLVFYALVCLLCAGLLLLSVWKTKPQKRNELLCMWRRLDFSLIVILAGLVGLLSFYGLRHYVQFHAVFRPQNYILFGLPLLTYTAAVLTAGEFIARIRDEDLLHTLYWRRFFKLYPVWTPLGLLLSLLLAGSLIVLIATSQEILRQIEVAQMMQARLEWAREPIAVIVHRSAAPPWLLLPFSLLTLFATTHFVTFALGLSDKYARASAEKIRAERFKSELITNVSHDIRTPLTSVINYVDLLKKLSLKGDAAEYISVLDRKSGRLKMLIDDLMDASKAGTGNEEVLMQTINLSEIVGQIAGEFEDAFTARSLTLVLTQPENLPAIRADNRHLWRVLENLFSNAAKYSLPGTRVFAGISLSDVGAPVFALKNTSQAPLDLSGDELTEQFIRADRARQSEGSGLGLYIAKNLVELMAGRFEIRVTGDLFAVEIEFSAQQPD